MAKEPGQMDALVAALIILAERNVPTDVQGLLVSGEPRLNVAPSALAAALETLSARVGELERMDREAASHVESVICLRSKYFTGEPPYVGWKGLGLALTQDYDRSAQLEAALRPLLSDKARKLLTDHANAAHAMEDRDYRAIADALRMLLDKDAKARAALSAPAAKGGDND